MENEKKREKLLTIFLGIFWLLDGILQLQPHMFTPAFINTILKPNLQNQPPIITSWINFGIHTFAMHMKIDNALFAMVQILTGALLLLPLSQRWKKFALWISIPWAGIIWVFSEGLGNLFTGSASFYMGAPGPVLLYLILAIWLLFPKKLSLSYLPRVTGLLFFLGGILQESPMFWTKGMQSMMWQMSQQDTVSFIAYPAKTLSSVAIPASISNFFAAGILVILGILLLVKPTKVVGWITVVFLFLIWWISQDFGAIFTFPLGTATDPNSAPLFILFLFPLLLSWKSTKLKRST